MTEDTDDDRMASTGSADLFPARRWIDQPWIWPLFGLVAVLVFELTASTGLAVAVFCAKLGLRDLRLGRWLWQRDPSRSRGLTTGLIASSMFGLKVTVASLIAVIVLVVLATVDPLRWNPGPELMECTVSLAITTGVSLVLSVLISTWGFIRALRTGQRVWLESGMIRAPYENVWPPECDGPPTRNGGIDIAQLGFLLQILVIVVGSVFAFHVAAPFPDLFPWLLGLAFVLIVASYLYLRFLVSRTIARHPGECWPELMERGGHIYFSDMLRMSRLNRPYLGNVDSGEEE